MEPDHPVSRSNPALVIIELLGVVAIIAVFLRLTSRRLNNVKLWWDDYLMILAAATLMAQVGFIFEAVIAGGESRAKEYSAASDESVDAAIAKWTFAASLSYPVTMTLIRCSVMCLYFRLFSTNHKFGVLCYLVGAFNIIWTTSNIIIIMVACVPVENRWKDPNHLRCRGSTLGFHLGSNVPNFLGDLAALLLPIPLVWKLQLSRSRKVGISVAILLGLITTTISCFRFTTVIRYDDVQPSWKLYCAGTQAVIEGEIGTICACIPTLMPLYRRCKARFTGPKQDYGKSSRPQKWQSPESFSLEVRPLKDQSTGAGGDKVPQGYIKRDITVSVVSFVLEERKVAF